MAKIAMDHDDLMQQAAKFQYIRFVCSDFNGIAKCKSATKSAFDQLKHGMGFYNGSVAMGPSCEIPLFLEKSDELCAKNGIIIPTTAKITPVPWATKGKYAVGEIICEFSNSETREILEMNPRTVARKQLERLQRHGLRLMSAFELECLILSSENYQPLNSQIPCLSLLPFSMYEEMLYDFDQNFQAAGIQVENFHCEYDPGSIEFSFVPTNGIDCADNVFKFKEGFKEMCLQKGYTGTFMTKAIANESFNGAHFNFSLWNEDNRNVFYDSSRPDNLSETCLHFIGGVLNHFKAVCAFCCPTVNCYRRLYQMCTPSQPDWEIDNRNVSLRVKNYDESGTYLECRLPSGSSNPYLVTGAIMAAGLDGIEKKTTPQPRGRGNITEFLPHSLAEALDALRQDEVLKEALGTRFVEWFLACKDNYEVKKFGGHDMKTVKQDELIKEQKEYIYYL